MTRAGLSALSSHSVDGHARPTSCPGSETMYKGTPEFYTMQARVPMASRPTGPGVFVAYPTGYPKPTGACLWRLGADAGVSPTATSMAITGSAVQGDAAVAADPSGRVWVPWAQRDGARYAIYARRSNSAATVFGAPVRVFVPAGIGSLWHTAADAQAGKVDVLAHMSKAAAGATTWHTQLLAGLSVTFSRTALKAKRKYSLAVPVKDAGTPVVDVTVKVRARAGKTNASGKVTLKVGPRLAGASPSQSRRPAIGRSRLICA